MEAEVKITCRAVCTIKRANGEEVHATINFVPAADDPVCDAGCGLMDCDLINNHPMDLKKTTITK